MKTLKELKGVKVLSKTEQKAITGGYAQCDSEHLCGTGWYCYYYSPLSEIGWCLPDIY